MNVVRPAVQENDDGPIGETGFGVADVQETGIDLLQRAQRRVRSRFDGGQPFGSSIGRLCCRRTDDPELRGRNRHASGAKKATAMPGDVFRGLDRGHYFVSLARWLAADQPNVNAKASTPGPRNSI